MPPQALATENGPAAPRARLRPTPRPPLCGDLDIPVGEPMAEARRITSARRSETADTRSGVALGATISHAPLSPNRVFLTFARPSR